MRTVVLTGLAGSVEKPAVRLHVDGAAASEVRPLVGLRLNYRADRTSPRRCVGHRRFGAGGSEHVDCANRPEPGRSTCVGCSVAAATFASNVHHAHTRDRDSIDPAYAAHLAQPNVLYLAAFRDGSVKVGTSTRVRVDQRLAEQGAWRAVVVADTTDGYRVRALEDRVTADLDLPQSVAVSRKLAGMVRPLPDDRLDTALAHHRASVLGVVAAMPGVQAREDDDVWSHPRADHETWDAIHPYPLDLIAGTHDLEVVDALGRIVALRRPDEPGDVFVADLQRLYGVELDVGDYQSDELAVQDSLF